MEEKRQHEARLAATSSTPDLSKPSTSKPKEAPLPEKPASQTEKTETAPAKDKPAPEPGFSAKNVEIRRMSGTEEGDKILIDAWNSPEKEKPGCTPLEMVQSIVSSIEEPEEGPEEKPPEPPKSDVPAWVHGGAVPMMHSQEVSANTNPPSKEVKTPTGPTTSVQPPSSAAAPAPPPVQGVQTGPNAPPVMQLINTVTGPMLVPVSTPQAVIPDQKSPKAATVPQQPVILSNQGQQLPYVMNQGAILTNLSGQQQLIIPNGSQLVMPTLYNQQLPDGTIIQMQSPAAVIQNQPLVVPNALQANSTYIMTPQGLVPAANFQPVVSAVQPGPSGQKRISKDVTEVKDVTDDSSSDEDDDEVVELDDDSSVVEEDPEELEPVERKKKKGKVRIQSNKVDSSGLKATPPHSADEKTADLVNESFEESSSGKKSKGSRPDRSSPSIKRQRKSSPIPGESDEASSSSSSSPPSFQVGEIIWGPHGNFPSWPGKLLSTPASKGSKAMVCWFGNKEVSQVSQEELKSLSDGLEAHHRERQKLRK